MKLRRISLGVASATLLISGGLASSTPAQAATPSSPTAVTCGHQPCSGPPGSGWWYVDTFHRLRDCIHAGDQGLYEGAWTAHECSGNKWEGYDLWVH